MKRLPLFLLLLGLAACQSEAPKSTDADSEAPYSVYGAADVTPDGALPVQQVAAAPAEHAGQRVKLEGTVTAVCQVKGCWLTLDAGDGPGVRIVMPEAEGDYVFTVPKDLSGRTVIVQGQLDETTLDAATQAHLAADAGQPIDAETLHDQPELQITAAAVLVKHI